VADRKTDEKAAFSDLLSAWTKSADAMRGAMAKSWQAVAEQPAAKSARQDGDRFQQTLAANLKLWETATQLMRGPHALETLYKSLQNIPEISMRLLQTSIEGVSEMQKIWLQRLESIVGSVEAYDFTDLDSSFLSRWSDLYKSEIQQYLNIPQIGLTKFYQEKVNQAVDKFNLFQAALVEFVYLLCIPMYKSQQVMKEKLSEIASEGSFPEDSKEYYRMWIKILEGHYTTLFKSEEYTRALGKAVETMNHFLHARDQVVEDMLQTIPVATHKDIDALSEDLYQLKRRMRAIEKQLQREEDDVNQTDIK
jgi:class III poly(R)-hydroxyalkanoic acid synthase PhaE subunit